MRQTSNGEIFLSLIMAGIIGFFLGVFYRDYANETPKPPDPIAGVETGLDGWVEDGYATSTWTLISPATCPDCLEKGKVITELEEALGQLQSSVAKLEVAVSVAEDMLRIIEWEEDKQ